MKRRLISFLLCISFLCSLLAVPASASTSADYNGLDICDVTIVDSTSVSIPYSEFQGLMDVLPIVAQMPRFKNMQQTGSEVTLTPQDIWIMYMYCGSSLDTSAFLEAYENKTISVSYNNGAFNVFTHAEPTPLVTRGGEDISETTQHIASTKPDTGYSIYVEVTARCREKWYGGSNVSFEFLSYSMSDPVLSPNADSSYKLDTITATRTENSKGSGATAWFNIWISTLHNGLSTMDYPAHRQFKWGNQ